MKVCMIAPNGRVLSIFKVQDFALAQLGVHAPNFLLGIAPDSLDFYWSGTEFVPLGLSPNEYCIFDYELRDWIDPRSLDELKNAKWNEVKQQRDLLEFGGFEFEGNTFDSDVTAQSRISTVAGMGVDIEWTLSDNSTLFMTTADLNGLLNALSLHVASAHERGRLARAAIFAATSKEEVELVVY